MSSALSRLQRSHESEQEQEEGLVLAPSTGKALFAANIFLVIRFEEP